MAPGFVAPAPLASFTPRSIFHVSPRYAPFPNAQCPSRRAQVYMTVADQQTKPTSAASANQEVDVLVVGTGISASSLSFNLIKNHPSLNVLVTEARSVVGGNVISRNENGYTWEEGPNTFQPAAHIMRLAVDLGLKEDIVLADSTLPRFVYWDEKLFALPLGPKDIPTFKLLSLPGMIRAGLGAFGLILPSSKKEESVKDFVTRHLGKEVFERMIDPFVSGVYAGDPSKLSVSAAFKKIYALQELGGTQGIFEGALIRIGQKKREAKPLDDDLPTWKGGALGSFRKGLCMLPEAVAERLGDRLRLEWRLDALQKTDDGKYSATYETPDGPRTIIAKTVAITAPANASAHILKDIAPGAQRLKEIYYPTVWSVTLAYPKSEFKEPLKGFGNLIPRSIGTRTLGTIWSSCLFPGRAPEGMELLLSYIGGAQDLDIKDLSEEEVVKAVDGDIKKILMKDGTEVKPVVVGTRRWERAIPQYNIGYWEILKEATESVAECPGIFLGGNYTSGVAFGDCVLWGTDTAPKIGAYVEEFASP